MTRDFTLRFPPDLLEKLDAELKRKYAPFKPPSRNSVIVQIIQEYAKTIEAENDQLGRPRET